MLIALFLTPSVITFAPYSVIMGKELLLRFSAVLILPFILKKLTLQSIPLILLAVTYTLWAFFAPSSMTQALTINACVILFLGITTLSDKDKISIIEAFAFGGGIAVAMTAAMSLHSSVNPLSLSSQFAMIDTFGNSNLYSIFLMAWIPLAIFVAKTRRIYYVIIAVALIEFIFTYSRGAYLGAVVALVVWFGSKIKVKWFISFALISFAIILAAQDIYPYFRVKLIDTPRAFAERLEIWSIGLKTFRDNPVFGGSPGVIAHDVDALRIYGGKLVDAHNDFINIAAETGIAGLLFYLLFVVFVIAKGVARRDTLGRLAFSGFIGIMVISLFTTTVIRSSTMIMPLLLAAIILSTARK